MVFEKKNPPSTFIDFSKKFQPPLLFQPPRLLILQLLHPLQVYSNLQGYYRDESIPRDFLKLECLIRRLFTYILDLEILRI